MRQWKKNGLRIYLNRSPGHPLVRMSFVVDGIIYDIVFKAMSRKTISLIPHWEMRQCEARIPLQGDFNLIQDYVLKEAEKQIRALKIPKISLYPFLSRETGTLHIEGIPYGLMQDNQIQTFVLDSFEHRLYYNASLTYKDLRQFLSYKLGNIINDITKECTIPGAHQTTITIRHLKGAWGICYFEKHKIIVNDALVHVPLMCLYLVVYHELCHLVYPNHQIEFHRLLESYVPNHRMITRELRSYEFYLKKDDDLIMNTVHGEKSIAL